MGWARRPSCLDLPLAWRSSSASAWMASSCPRTSPRWRPRECGMRFFRTPKGLLLLVLAGLVAVSAPVEGVRVVAPGLVAAVVVSAAIDAVILRWRDGQWSLPSGAILTALIVAMILTSHEPTFVVVSTAVVGVLSKYIVRAGGANVFNPAALALVATFYVFDTGQSWWGALPALPTASVALLVAGGVFITD